MRRVLVEVSLITPAVVVVALFCEFLGLESRDTAVFSLLSLVFISICRYRKFIGRTVPSAVLAGLLVSFGGIFYFNYSYILIKDTGLIKYFKKSSAFLSEIDEHIKASEKSIWFFGTNFYKTAGERREEIKERLSNDVTVRFLILNPSVDDEVMERYARDFNQTRAELCAECLKGIESLRQLRNEWDSERKAAGDVGNLEIRFYDTSPKALIYSFDPEDEDGRTYFVPYMNTKNTPRLPGFLLENKSTGVAAQYHNALKDLWASAVEAEQLGGLEALRQSCRL